MIIETASEPILDADPLSYGVKIARRFTFDAHVRRIEQNLPEYGNVFIFQFTDRQYENIIRFSDQSRRTKQKNPGQLVLF